MLWPGLLALVKTKNIYICYILLASTVGIDYLLFMTFIQDILVTSLKLHHIIFISQNEL